MNIIFETDLTADIADKYILLELDTFKKTSGETLRSFCVVSNEDITLQDIPTLEKFQELHENLIKNYRLRNWDFCDQAISHLQGKWKGECDSFYSVLGSRVSKYKSQPVPESWDYCITLPG